MLTQERLKELLIYNPDTGVFTHKILRRGRARGSVAGCRHHTGYIFIQLDEKKHLAHRLAFLYMTGALPANHTDHINGIEHDNR
jgi:phospholipid N-methyltransferase